LNANKFFKSWCAVVSRLAQGLLLSLIASNAHALVVTIDANQSIVTFSGSQQIICDVSGNCGQPPPQTFALSGSFDVVFESQSFPVSFFPLQLIDVDLVRFDSPVVDAGGGAALGFSLPRHFGIVSGQSFASNGNPCELHFAGGCSAFGSNGEFSGEFDGVTLLVSGHGPSSFGSVQSYRYDIVAHAAAPTSVSEPGVLACLALGVIGLAAIRRQRLA
jgi:hypothetical protein